MAVRQTYKDAFKAAGFPGLRVTCEAVPFQVEGTLDGCHVYIRARGGKWWIGTGTTRVEAAESAVWQTGTCATGRDDGEPIALGPTPEEAVMFVAHAIAELVH